MHIHKLAIHEFSLAYISFMLCRFVHIAACRWSPLWTTRRCAIYTRTT